MPKIVDTKQRREQIARAAAEVISERGLESASIREVAKRTGATRGFIEHYFENKTELVGAAIDWLNASYLRRINKAVAGKRGLAALRARFEYSLPKSPTTRNEWRLRLRFWSSPDQDINTVQRQRLQIWLKVIEEDIIVAQSLGEISPAIDAKQAAQRLFYILSGLSTLSVADKQSYNRDFLLTEFDRQLGKLENGTL
ncbi:TetR/AcrR family transcriptional regulator [Novosphingobium naphthalenivorans]|uniref:TetR/AcrR family transcriptional regulator n=1 Tax=Novosphingobium naphthalenivorans TaxID=273168 RepID=UPI000831E378|nr:TetR/AcrR family transcriptional regulator [Novosphingobium naphthalenivorans]